MNELLSVSRPRHQRTTSSCVLQDGSIGMKIRTAPPRIAALAALLASALFIDTAVSKPVCPADFPVVGECFSIHGRLTISASLRPRVWRIGTKRLLQVEWKGDDEDSGLTPEIAQTFRDDLGAAI